MNVTKEEFKQLVMEHPTIKASGIGGVNDIEFEDFEKSVKWMSENLKPSPTYKVESYELKHLIENSVGGYIPNGAAIMAGYFLKIPQKSYKNSLNTKLRVKYSKEAKIRYFGYNH